MALYNDMDGNSDVFVSFVNQTTTPHERWTAWKPYDKCTPSEKYKFNLRQIFDNEIIYDFEDIAQLNEKLEEFKKSGLKFFPFLSGSKGFHIHVYFKDFSDYAPEVRNEARKISIEKWKSDVSKSSENTMIAAPNRPHFKTMKEKTLIPGYGDYEGWNLIFPKDIIQQAIDNIAKNKDVLDNLKEIDFKDWHLSDPIFVWAEQNGIGDGMERDTVLFPNWAIALVKEGLTRDEIEKIIKPMLKKMPGKHYAEFEGWLDKAINKVITDFNPIQLNKWIKKYNLPIQLYDLQPLELDLFTNLQPNTTATPTTPTTTPTTPNPLTNPTPVADKWKIWKDGELLNTPQEETKWLVEKWIATGDTCFIAGRASSYKSTLLLDIGVCVANGKPLFGKYATTQSKVLYLNEENNRALMHNMYGRITRGLHMNPQDIKNFYMTIMENIRLDTPKLKPDQKTDLEFLADVLKRETINVLVLDSFKRFTSFDENDANKTNEFFHKLNKLKSLMGADFTVIILHHLKKETAGHIADPRDMMRGSSDIVNAADTVIFINRKVGKNSFTMQHIKLRADAEMEPKLILVKDDTTNNSTELVESTATVQTTSTMTKDQKCAEEILKSINNKVLPGKTVDPNNPDASLLSKTQIEAVDAIRRNYTDTDISRALKDLVDSNIIERLGSGKNTKYRVDKSLFEKRMNQPKEDTGESLSHEASESAFEEVDLIEPEY